MKRVAQIAKALVLAPFGIAIGILVFGVLGIMAIPISISGYFEQRKWLREMRASGRTRTAEELAEGEKSGTLIVDNPGWAGKSKYCWWTPDDIESLAPMSITPFEERMESLKSEFGPDSLPLDRWVYDNYLSDTIGKAYLVAARGGDLVASKLQTQMIDSKLIRTWSGPVSEFGRSDT